MGANTRSLRRLTRAIWLVLVLNLVDALATLFWVTRGHMPVEMEMNVNWATMLHHNSYVGFLAAKLSLVTIACIGLYRGRKCLLAHALIRIPIAAYFSVVVGHAVNAFMIL